MTTNLRQRAKELGNKLKAKEPEGKNPTPSRPSRNGNHFESYYDSAKKSFWSKNSRGEWMEITESSLRRNLRANGFSKDEVCDNTLRKDESKIMTIQNEYDVHYAGPLAGYPIGLHEVCDNRVLVTRQAKVLTPAKGGWRVFRKLVESLLGDQWPYFFAWIKSAMRSLRAGPPFRPGQMLAVAGPAGCGKSLLQGIITELFGGRVAKPYRYLTGDTAFNAELFAAEHLAIEDEAASTDLRTRKHFGAQLKNLIVNEVQWYHGKGRQAISLHPFWRVSITLNDEPENLMVLPPMEDSLRDKIIFLRASSTVMPFEADDLESRRKFRQTITSELPAFLRGLSDWKIPERMRDQRYGVKAYQNPGLVAELDSLAPEYRLLGMIDTFGIFGIDGCEWTGSAAELERRLRERDNSGEVNRLLTFPTACGVYLGRLARAMPERFKVVGHKKNQAVWSVNEGH